MYNNIEDYWGIDMKTLLFIKHQGKGGVQRNINDLASLFVNEYKIILLENCKDIINYYEYINSEYQLISSYNYSQNGEEYSRSHVSFRLLMNIKPDLIHIHSFLNFDVETLAMLKKKNRKIVFTVHDYYMLCPNYILISDLEDCCEGNCLYNYGFCKNGKEYAMGCNDIFQWRKLMSSFLKYIDCFIFPSDDTRKRFVSVFSDDYSVKIIEHGITTNYEREYYGEYPQKGKKIKILLLGNTYYHKGVDDIINFKNIDVDNKIQLYALGKISNRLTEYVIYQGEYNYQYMDKYVKKIRPSYAGFFSKCPETYGYTLTEAWSCGIPTFSNNLGALGTRSIINKCKVYDSKNMKELYNWIVSVSFKEYKELLGITSRCKYSSLLEMKGEYKKVYECE